MSEKTCTTYDRFEKRVCGLPVEPGFGNCQHHFVDAGRRRTTVEDWERHNKDVQKGDVVYLSDPVLKRQENDGDA